jgi:hypothetical protein
MSATAAPERAVVFDLHWFRLGTGGWAFDVGVRNCEYFSGNGGRPKLLLRAGIFASCGRCTAKSLVFVAGMRQISVYYGRARAHRGRRERDRSSAPRVAMFRPN